MWLIPHFSINVCYFLINAHAEYMLTLFKRNVHMWTVVTNKTVGNVWLGLGKDLGVHQYQVPIIIMLTVFGVFFSLYKIMKFGGNRKCEPWHVKYSLGCSCIKLMFIWTQVQKILLIQLIYIFPISVLCVATLVKIFSIDIYIYS